MEKDRKTSIADAAIYLLGTEGARGLTHRGVDTVAGLPIGSTSFYCRSKAELLSLTLLRHAALDMADLEADWLSLRKETVTASRVVDLIIDRVADWASQDKRIRLMARFEIFLIASRDPQLLAVLNHQREGFMQFLREQLKALGVREATLKANMLAFLVDGLLLEQVRHGAPVMTQVQQRVMFRELLGV